MVDSIKILLVEDSPTHAEMIRHALEGATARLQLTLARSLAEARDRLAEFDPDLLLVDYLLPDGKGTELLPADPEQIHWPMVFLTGEGDEQVAVEAIKGGALDYVVKSARTLADMPRIVERSRREWGHIIERRRAEDALRHSEERFRSIFETAAAGMVMTAPDGSFMQVNPAFVRFIGYEEAELLTMSVLDVTHPEDREWTQEYYQRLSREQDRIIDTEKRYLRKDGKVRWGHTSVACVLGEDDAEEYCVGLVQDITRRKQMEDRIQEVNRELDTFVYTVSHDLRTPLTPIVGYAQYLKSAYANKLDAQALDILGEIDRAGQTMAAMIEDLLNLAKLGALKLPDEPLDVRRVVSELLDVMGSQIIEAAMEIRVGDLPEVRLPKTLLSQIFDNLIGNAVRYAGSDGSPIEVGGNRDGGRVRFFVRDHGPGIPDREKEKVFEVFYRGISATDRRGTGIGLATIQKIARLYDGKAWIEDTPGGGATFCVEMVG